VRCYAVAGVFLVVFRVLLLGCSGYFDLVKFKSNTLNWETILTQLSSDYRSFKSLPIVKSCCMDAKPGTHLTTVRPVINVI